MSDMEKFQGDMSRNEVEIDLKKFMSMVSEIGDLKQEIFELTQEDRKNPWQKWIFAAKTIDAWRIIPRAFLGIYMYLLYYVTLVYGLNRPNTRTIGIDFRIGWCWCSLVWSIHFKCSERTRRYKP
jgi:hypothetical protein